jgi:hypothetical protein
MTAKGYSNPDDYILPSCKSIDVCENETKKWDLFADILYWNLQETNTQWAFLVNPKFVSPASGAFSGAFSDSLEAVTFDWSTGTRTGISYTLDHDLWNTQLYYTWYHTSGSSHVFSTPDLVIQSQFIATDFLLTLPAFSLSFNEAKIKWNVLFNMFNWDIGRDCWISPFLSLRPFLGVQGGWIHQNIHAHWMNSNTVFPYSAEEVLKHRFWGVGPVAGLNSHWNIGCILKHAFSLYYDLSQVFMWGHWSFNEVAHTTINVNTISTQPDRKMGSLTLHSGAGFVWDYTFKKRAQFTLKFGYELQVWMQHLQFFQHFSGLLNNALILQGGTFRFLFKF